MLVCDELGNCYDDPTLDSGGTGSIDSGDPCDPTSVAYDPVACANVQGGFEPQGGDTTPGIGTFDPSVDPTSVAWCQANPGSCDFYGPDAYHIDQFCADNPDYCGTLSDGTVGVRTSTGSLRPPGGGISVPAGAPGATGGGSGFLAGLTSFLNGLFSTCPPGFIKAANGQCISSASVSNPRAIQAGLGQGMIGGVSVGTLAIIAVVIVILAMRKR